MIGYDTLHLSLELSRANQADIANVARLLTNESVSRDTGEAWSSGNVGNLRVVAGGAGLSVKGSIAAFFGENNTLMVSRRDVKKAVEQMSDSLHINMLDARVTRLDICSNLMMQNAVKAYLDVLGSLAYFQRIQATQSTLYYQRGKENLQSLCFYDKQVECSNTHKQLPQVYADCGNMLRYEARFKGRIAKQFKRTEVTASTLADDAFFVGAVNKWGELYFGINKLYNFISMSKIKTVSDGKDYLLAVALANMEAGDIDRILTEMKAKGVYADRKYYTRLRKSIEAVGNKFTATGGNDLARELDDEVRTVLAYK